MSQPVYIPVDVKKRKNLQEIPTPAIYDNFRCSEEMIFLDKEGNYHLGVLKIWTTDFYILDKLTAKKGKIEFSGLGFTGANITHYLKQTTLEELTAPGLTGPEKI